MQSTEAMDFMLAPFILFIKRLIFRHIKQINSKQNISLDLFENAKNQTRQNNVLSCPGMACQHDLT